MLPGELNKFSLFSDAVQEANATDLRVSILRADQVMVCSVLLEIKKITSTCEEKSRYGHCKTLFPGIPGGVFMPELGMASIEVAFLATDGGVSKRGSEPSKSQGLATFFPHSAGDFRGSGSILTLVSNKGSDPSNSLTMSALTRFNPTLAFTDTS